jgi:hypothetical protein
LLLAADLISFQGLLSLAHNFLSILLLDLLLLSPLLFVRLLLLNYVLLLFLPLVGFFLLLLWFMHHFFGSSVLGSPLFGFENFVILSALQLLVYDSQHSVDNFLVWGN